MTVNEAHQVWALDTAYTRWHAACVPDGRDGLGQPKGLAHRVAITLEAMHTGEVLQEAFAKCGRPEIVNTDQGSQLTARSRTVADATTLLKFRRLLNEHDLTRKLFDEIGIMLCERGLMMKEGTIVDATIIEAPPSTKNADKSRDPEMHQTKKGNEWHFGMKAHIGVDASSGAVHSVVGTAANESDVSQAHALLHGHETDAFGDAGYTGVEKRDEMQGKRAKWHVALKRGKIKAMREGPLKDLLIAVERTKAQIRARVEHPFHVIKNLFGHRKVRYKGLAKNTAQMFSLFGLANLVLARRQLLASPGSIAS